MATDDIEPFYLVKGDYEKLSYFHKRKRIAFIAKQIIPPGSPIQISSPQWDLTAVILRYVLYPLEITEEWGYLIDIDNFQKDPDPSWKIYRLSPSIRIFVKPGFELNTEIGRQDHCGKNFYKNHLPFHFVGMILIFLGVTTIFLLTGWMLLWLLKINSREGGETLVYGGMLPDGISLFNHGSLDLSCWERSFGKKLSDGIVGGFRHSCFLAL